MTNTRFLIAIFTLVLATSATAQRYKTAAGIRIENGFNLTVQQYITDGWTAEGILHMPLGTDKMGISVLAEKHKKILFRGINFYTGAGMHFYGINEQTNESVNTTAKVFGLSGIAGGEISLGRLNLSVDWKPELHLSGDQVRPFEWNGAAISARYIIAKRERKKVKDWAFWDKFKR